MATEEIEPRSLIEWLGADGAFVTRTEKALLWLRELHIDTTVLLPASSTELSRTINVGGGRKYGLGMIEVAAVQTKAAGIGRVHTGGVFGFTTSAWSYPATKAIFGRLMAEAQGDFRPVESGALTALKTLRETP